MKGASKAALASIMALSVLGASEKAMAASSNYVKCYGVAAAGKNDCATAISACTSSIKVDRACYAYIDMPKGLCEKIAGSSIGKPTATCKLPNGKPAVKQ